MKPWMRKLGLGLALGVLALSFFNASWLAPAPKGRVKLIAHRGTYQQYSHAGLTRDGCTATRIEAPVHLFHENTLGGIAQARRLGARMVEIDIAPTADGRIAVFHDWTLDCRTDGQGETRAATMAQLKALDATHGYTADGGRSFPFRGQGMGQIPELGEVLAAFPDTPLLFNFKSRNPAEANLLAQALKAAGRDPVVRGDGFYGGPEAGPVARIRQLYPKAWVFSGEEVKQCTGAYGWQGWLGLVPEACKGGTIMIPLNYQWAFAGWPNRLIARMEAAGARVVVIGPHGADQPRGLDLPEQIGQIPASFNGYVWVEDIWTIGPALRPAYNKRNPREEAELAKALDARRKARD